MNVTTLLVPLFALRMLAQRIIAPDTAYVDLRYAHALALSTTYQAGVVAWVGFWPSTARASAPPTSLRSPASARPT